MNKFNLTFNGEVLSDQDPDQVKVRFGELFGIQDADRLSRFFSGETVILRRNLERREAAECFQNMRRIGAVAELVKVSPQEQALDQTRRERLVAETQRQQEAAAHEEAQRAEEARRRDEERQLLETQRHAEEERERKAAEKARRLQEAAQQATRQKAEQAQRKRLAAEAAARKKAERERLKAERAQQRAEKARKKAAEQAAREQQKALAAKRKAEEKAAREAVLRQAAEAAAQREAEEQERKRVAAELAAQEQQKALEAQRIAEEEARREAALRQAAEAAAQRKAEEKERKCLAAEKVAQHKAKEKERERLDAEKAAQREAQEKEGKRLATDKAAQREELEAKTRRLAAQETARQKVLDDVEQSKAAQQEQGQLQALEERAINRGAAELARGVAIKPVHANVRTRMEVPQRTIHRGGDQEQPPVRKRQAGEPNLYSLAGFRVTAEIRARVANSLKHMQRSLLVLCAALLGLVALVVLRHQLPPETPLTGPSAVAANSNGDLYILAGDRLLAHDRAGIGTNSIDIADLGVTALQGPLFFLDNSSLLALGERRLPAAGGPTAVVELLHCDLKVPECAALSPALAGRSIATFHPHPIDGSVFVLDAASNELLQLDSNGEIANQAEITLPPAPVLNLDSGLLLINSAEGPAISVYRYDKSAFGQQLDEVLLLPAAAAGHDRVGDFLRNGDTWWALMYNSETGATGLHKFDDQWAYLGKTNTPPVGFPVAMGNWGEKVLVYSDAQTDMARVNRHGEAEAAFSSKILTALVEGARHRARLSGLGWQLGVALLTLLVLAATWWAYKHHIRALVYKPRRQHGAQPVDDYADQLAWVAPSPNRARSIRTRGISFTLLALALCLMSIGLGASAIQLGAVLIALGGIALSLLIFYRQPIGHIGVLGEQLLLVDHGDMYHFGAGSDIQYRGNFLIIEDVVVFSGNALWPSFLNRQVQELVTPVAQGGVKVDRKTLLVKLLERRHPIIRSAFVLLGSGVAAITLLIAAAYL